MRIACTLYTLIVVCACQTVKSNLTAEAPSQTPVNATLPQFVQERQSEQGILSIVIEAKTGTKLDRLQTLTEDFAVRRNAILDELLSIPTVAIRINETEDFSAFIDSQIRAGWEKAFAVNQISHLYTGTSYLLASMNIDRFIQNIETFDSIQSDFMTIFRAVLLLQTTK